MVKKKKKKKSTNLRNLKVSWRAEGGALTSYADSRAQQEKDSFAGKDSANEKPRALCFSRPPCRSLLLPVQWAGFARGSPWL